MHINGIADKYRKTKSLGPNPFDYLGYQFSDDGKKLYPCERKNGKWVQYGDFDSYTLKNAAPQVKRGKLYKLSSDYRVYDWIADDGYNNFAKWVE